MRKIQNKAKVISIEIPNGLADYNESNNANRARLQFAYVSNNSDGGIIDGIDNDAQAFLSTMVSGSVYSVIIDLASVKTPEKVDALDFVREKLEGKVVICTTFVAEISELLKGTENEAETFVNNPDLARTYRTLSNSYVGVMNDEDAAFRSIKDRLLRNLDDGTLEFGEYEPETNSQKRGNRR